MSSAYIPPALLEILEYIVESDKSEKSPSTIMTKATWQYVKEHPAYAKFLEDTTQDFGKKRESVPVEAS